MIAWQKQIREQRKAEDSDADLFGRWWENLDLSLTNAKIEQISFKQAQKVIEKYEWLGNMGTTEVAFGLVCGSTIVGVVCFGSTAGSNASASVFGDEMKSSVMTLCRGACVHYAHQHAASFLISGACKNLATKGIHGFIAYSDPQAGEIGTVYQACGWQYTGMTNPTEKFITPDGEVKDARLVHAYTRDRRNGQLNYKRTRAEQKILMLKSGHKFFMGHAKHRYIGVYGKSPSHARKLKAAILYENKPYPKRDKAQEGAAGVQPEGKVQFLDRAPFS